jgi:hypothetical protein
MASNKLDDVGEILIRHREYSRRRVLGLSLLCFGYLIAHFQLHTACYNAERWVNWNNESEVMRKKIVVACFRLV